MNQRLMLIAVAISAFVLVLVGGLSARLSTQPMEPTVAVLDPSIEAAFQERELAYQTALAEANARLEAANTQIAQNNASAPVSPAVAVPAAAAPAAPSYAVSSGQAEQIALQTVPGSQLVRAAELVSYQGSPAYEVRLDRGDLYIDAQSGAVLFDGSVVVAESGPINAEQAARIALDYLGGGEIKEVERERERGMDVYEVKFRDGREIYVDAASGAVVYAQINNGGDDDDREEYDD